MIELTDDSLVVTFPDVYPRAKLTIDFQRTLRIPDDDEPYPLPPGLGRFPLRHVDDYERNIPRIWLDQGGIMLPMYQAEALWINFHSTLIFDRSAEYPFAVKIGAGKINAVSGTDWGNNLKQNPQNYIVAPEQPWLDGYCVDKGIIRQFVAMPLGEGYSAEEQLTEKAEYGGLQLQIYPMKKEVFEERFPVRNNKYRRETMLEFQICEPAMGLAPGGKMKQEVYDDPYGLSSWDLNNTSKCFVHIANSLQWKAITKTSPPMKPPTPKQYSQAGLPWFDYYSDGKAIAGTKTLAGLHSLGKLFHQKMKKVLSDNETIETENVIKLGKRSVREGNF